MKVKIFKYLASYDRWADKGGGECLDIEKIEREVNAFCETVNVLDIKMETVDYRYHNNSGYNGVTLIYTIVYEEKLPSF